MEPTETPTLVVFEKPSLQDQVITAAVGALATIVATVVISAGADAVSKAVAKRREKKNLAKTHVESTDSE